MNFTWRNTEGGFDIQFDGGKTREATFVELQLIREIECLATALRGQALANTRLYKEVVALEEALERPPVPCPRCNPIGEFNGRADCENCNGIGLVPALDQQKPIATAEQDSSATVKCRDCGVAYAGLGCDLVLPDQQWKALFPEESGLLCANCICQRAAKVGGSALLAWVDSLDYGRAHRIKFGRYVPAKEVAERPVAWVALKIDEHAAHCTVRDDDD